MSSIKLLAAGIMVTFAFSIPSWAISDRLTVVASVFPLFDITREVAGSDADVRVLLPPGVDPHSWEPKPSDILELSRSDIFLYTSDSMEPWAGGIAGAVAGNDVLIVPVMDNLGFPHAEPRHGSGSSQEEDYGHGEDPHFWLDLLLSERTVKMVEDLLIRKDPANRNRYVANAGTYAERLHQLDMAFMSGLKECASRLLVTGGHAAFGHLTRRYGLKQISVYGLNPDSEPTPRHLAGIISEMKKYNVRTIFSEELMNPRMAEVISQETGARVMVLNPGGNLTAAQWREGLTFLEIMNRNLEILREGLDCE